jgi:hypothetical protein
MSELMRPKQIAVQKDLSGGVRIQLGNEIGLMSPDQAFEYAMVILKTIGVEVNAGPGFPAPARRHFRAG